MMESRAEDELRPPAAPDSGRPATSPHRRSRWLRRLGLALLGVVAVLAAAAGLFYASLPDVGDAPARVARILQLHRGRRTDVAPSAKFARAIVAVEDERFFSHGAVDFVALGRVVLNAVTAGSVDAGGSTITQQLAKTLYVEHPDSLGGRLRAVGLAYKLESRYSKPQILDMYLNAIYFGHGFYGVERASRGYFGRSVNELSWAQATLLAGLPQAPSAFDPFVHPGLSRARQRDVLRQLVARRILSAAAGARIVRQGVALR
jgi:penicillin-binding protein 1A